LARVVVLAVVFGFFLAAQAPAEAGGKSKRHRRHIGFFHRICHAIRHVGSHIVNGIMDTGVHVHHALTGKKRWVWVCGHCTSDGRYVSGHWRYVKPHAHSGKGGPGQGGPGQGGAGQGNNPPPAPPPAKDDRVSPESPLPPLEPPAPPTDAGQPPADGQTPPAQPMTLGQLMNSLVDLSGDMDAVEDLAVETKKAKTEKEASPIEADYTLLATDRETDSNRLIKVVCDDLEKNNGQPGVFYTAFLWNLQHYTPAQLESLKDIVETIKVDIRANIAQEKKNHAYPTRLDELTKY
jgi:hypothetical protein